MKADYQTSQPLPVSCRRHVAYYLFGHIVWHEGAHRVADKTVGVFNIIPQVFPGLRLWRARYRN